MLTEIETGMFVKAIIRIHYMFYYSSTSATYQSFSQNREILNSPQRVDTNIDSIAKPRYIYIE